ncbi:MAG: ribosomal-processing cysteine protease Prp [Spirochaetota bacterium]
MIKVRLLLERDGCLKILRAKGHAGGLKTGSNIVCAAATAIMRTMVRILESNENLHYSGNAEKPGTLDFEIVHIPEEKRVWFKGVTDYLVRGLQDLAEEYPRECKVDIRFDR